MPKYIITITETLERTIEVTAPNEERAMEKVLDQYRDEEIILDASDYVDTSFDIEEAIIEGDE